MKKLFLIPLMAMLCTVMAWAVDITSRSQLQSFLETPGTNTGVIAANLDLTAEGAHFVVAGTKELTINDNVTLSLTSAYDEQEEEQPNGYDGHGFCFYVQNGANLTVKGDGTIAADRSVFFVAEGGELTIGEEDKTTQLHITTTVGNVKQRIVVSNGGRATVYNGNFVGRSGVFWTSSYLKIDGGEYLGQSSASDPVSPLSSQHTYAVNGLGNTIIKNALIKGVHGAVAPADGGRVDIDNCTLIADPTFSPLMGTVKSGKTKWSASNISSYRPLYCATYAICTVRNSRLYSKKRDCMMIGNNDSKTKFGIIYLFENCYLYGSTNSSYPKMSQKSATDDPQLFPVEIDENSEWYSVATTGTTSSIHMPLPYGVEYAATSETIDGLTYNVKTIGGEGSATEEDVIDSDDPTIPWQQQTTWASDEVPTEETAVTIPEGKAVVVDNTQTEKTATANQVYLAGEGASLTVQEGTTLNIDNNLTIAAGAKVVVDAGAVVTVGAGGVVSTSDNAIEIKTSEQKYGVFMIAPTVTENTHPMATVQMKSKAYKKADGTYVWQRFGVPSYMEGVTRGDILYDHVAAPTSVLKLDYENHTWASMNNDDTFVPFRCYELTTTATTPGEVYTFNCPLMGNGNAELVIEGDWNYYANSYSAPIDIATLLNNYVDNVTSVQATVYLYRASDNWWLPINMFAIDENEIPDSMKVIRPMQAFIFQRWQGGENPTVNYANEVYNPIVSPASAPRRTAMQNTTKVTINLTTANGKTDYVRLVEGTNFSEDFDNGYDAVKYMNADAFNFYAPTMDGNMVYLATNNLGGQLLSLNTKEETSFTMTFSGVRGKVYTIKDMLTGTETLMQEGNTYCFSTNDNATIDGRFQIINRQEMPTGMESVQDGMVGSKGIYTIMGQYLGETTEWNNLPAGIYVVDGVKMVK